MTDIPLPQNIDFETVSTCNRVCPTCLRNSFPDRKEVQSWFEPNYLPVDYIVDVLKQASSIGYAGNVCLSHFNEPLMDERLPDIVHEVFSIQRFPRIFINTNGDYITEDLAHRLEDAGLSRIIVTLYMGEPVRSKRREWIKSLFTKTECIVVDADHIASHYSPSFDTASLANQYINHDCKEPQMRAILNHRAQWLVCCEDLVGIFHMGSYPITSFSDYWFGEKHTNLYKTLLETGGRRKFAHCSSCPKS